MSSIVQLEYFINNYMFESLFLYKSLNNCDMLYIQLFCSTCNNYYCYGGCCTQSKNTILRPVKVLTKKDIIEQIDKDFYTLPSPFEIISLSTYLDNIKGFDNI